MPAVVLSQLGLTGQQVDVLHGGDVHPDGRLLTIAEIAAELAKLGGLPAGDRAADLDRTRLRIAYSHRGPSWKGPSGPVQRTLFPSTVPPLGAPAEVTSAGAPADSDTPEREQHSSPAGGQRDGGTTTLAGSAEARSRVADGRTGGDTSLASPGIPGDPRMPEVVAGAGGTPIEEPRGAAAPDPAPDPRAGLEVPQVARQAPSTGGPRRLLMDPAWVVVVAAHAGAGATSVAVMVADAVAAAGRAAHLIDTSRPSRSGLVGVASRELGQLEGGRWQRGTRDGVTVDRPTSDAPPTGWPELSTGTASGTGGVTVLDLGLAEAGPLSRLAAARCRTVLVARCTVPGVRAVERQLSVLSDGRLPGDGRTVVALLGPGRWPGPVAASAGPVLRGLHGRGRVVTVPADRRLEATGLTSRPLPRPLIGAGRGLLAHLDQARPGPSATGATGAPTEGNT